MTKEEFRNFAISKLVILDGATGSNLQKRGMPNGVCPEKWIIENREIFIKLQEEYVEAGSDIVYAPTFSANRIKLKEFGLENNVFEMNKELVSISKSAVNRKAFVAGDLTMTGEQLAPYGTLDFEELVEVYKEQIRALTEAKADLLVVETMMSLQETRAALIAAKEVSLLPVIVTMSFNEDGRTLFGSTPAAVAVVLESLGADAIGINCSVGPDKMGTLVEEMSKVVTVPLIVKPNAGLPQLSADGSTEYDMSPESFSKNLLGLIEKGASIVGGCCGTSPEYIKELDLLRSQNEFVYSSKRADLYLSSERIAYKIDENNFTLDKSLSLSENEELKCAIIEEDYDMILDLLEELDDVDIIMLSAAHPDITEKEEGKILQEMMETAVSSTQKPLCFSSKNIHILENILHRYPGRALLDGNVVELEEQVAFIATARKYGAVILTEENNFTF